MNKWLKTIRVRSNKTLLLNNLPIKTLALLGFGLVLVPLIVALLYSASQVNHIANKGSQTIFNVAKLVETNQQLTASTKSMQRFASQYVVLQQASILKLYQEHKDNFISTIKKHQLASHPSLMPISTALTASITQLDIELTTDKPNSDEQLKQIELLFKGLTAELQAFTQQSNQLITEQVTMMNDSAEQVSATILQSLLIIPFSILIAIVFIRLIQQPLNKLSHTIKRLEQGRFDEKISYSGAKEIQEIAKALELMRSRLHSLELQKSSFIRHISHELKTPLAAIREGTALLYDNSVGTLNAGQHEITNIIKQSVSRLQQLIEDLLDFNIVLDSTSLQDAENVALAPLIEQCMTLRKLDLQSKQLQVKVNCQSIAFKTNAKQLSVIIDNLLSNAIKYSPIKGVISISAVKDSERVIMTISDQGTGIAPAIQKQVFDAFYQGPAPDKSTIKSSGLGLTIVKELLMRLQGDIELTNLAAPAHGLHIKLTFLLK